MFQSANPSPLISCTPRWDVLELDHPDHLECYSCKKLHSMTDVLAHPELWSRCRKGHRKLRISKFLHPNFDLLIFRLIMKQYRQGKGLECLDLLAYRGSATIEDTQVKKFSAEPRILNGRLLLRSQTVYVVPPGRWTNKAYLLERNLLKCPHTMKWSRCNAIVTERLHQRSRVLEKTTASRREHIMERRCPFCPTEFNVSLEKIEGKGLLLFIIKWLDIGMGLSPLEEGFSPTASRHLDPYVTPRTLDYESPRARFEGLQSNAVLPFLSREERGQLFTLYNSLEAKLLRWRDKIRWPVLGCGRPFPRHGAPMSERELSNRKGGLFDLKSDRGEEILD